MLIKTGKPRVTRESENMAIVTVHDSSLDMNRVASSFRKKLDYYQYGGEERDCNRKSGLTEEGPSSSGVWSNAKLIKS